MYNYTRFKAHHILDALATFSEVVPNRLSMRDFFVKDLGFKESPIWTSGIMVLEIGSLTCPLYASNIEAMRRLTWEYPTVDFKVLAVREAHPGERLGPHANEHVKNQRARMILNAYKESREIVTESCEGTLHQTLGHMPNSVFIIDAYGRIAYASPFNNPEMTERALELLLQGESVGVKPVTRPESPFTKIGTQALLKGGWVALWDMIKAMPTLVQG